MGGELNESSKKIVLRMIQAQDQLMLESQDGIRKVKK